MDYFFSTIERDGYSQRYLVTDLPAVDSAKLKAMFEGLYHLLPPEDRRYPLIVRLPVKHSLGTEIVESMLDKSSAAPKTRASRYNCVREIRNELESTFTRFRFNAVHLLFSDSYLHQLSSNVNPLTSNDPLIENLNHRHHVLRQIQRDEIDHLVESGRCLLPPIPESAYRIPSGRLVKSFLRVGNLQISRNALDAIFFWLLPYLKDCVGIVSDTWTISSITQVISRRLSEYGLKIQPPPPIEILPGYHADAAKFGMDAANLIEKFIGRVGNGDGQRIVILLSATHTGSLATHLNAYLSDRSIGIQQVAYVSLFKLSSASSVTTLRDLSDDSNFETISEEDGKNLTQIVIDGQNHIPESHLLVQHRAKPSIIRPIREMLNRHEGLNFARVHYTDPRTDMVAQSGKPGRHHAVWIEIQTLLESNVFVDDLLDRVSNLKPLPKVIVYPPHQPAELMIEKIKSHFASINHACGFFAHANLQLNPDLRENDGAVGDAVASLGVNDSILFLDDTFITGLRIYNYQRNIRDLSFNGTMHYLVGVCRPNDMARWNEKKRAFCGAVAGSGLVNTFQAIEALVLPNWNEAECPWCLEKTLLSGGYLPDSRKNRLADTSIGLTSDLFLVPKGVPGLMLKKGSFIGPEHVNQAVLFLAIACVLQTLRTEAQPCLGDPSFMVNSVLDHATITTDYSDPILVASFLRATLASELVYADLKKEKEKTERFRALISQDESDGIVAEILLAMNARKFPEMSRSDAAISNQLEKHPPSTWTCG